MDLFRESYGVHVKIVCSQAPRLIINYVDAQTGNAVAPSTNVEWGTLDVYPSASPIGESKETLI